MNKSLITILITIFLDVLGLGLVIPVLPFIIKSYGGTEFYVGLTFSIFSIGMLVGGLIFGKLSDKFGRKNILCFTIGLNLLGYLIFANSPNLMVFLVARFIGGLGGSGFGVGQAFIADISTNENRTKNMGLMGAMFGIGFILGPVFGSLLSGSSLNSIGYISAFAIFLNLILVIFVMKEPVHHKYKDISEVKTKLKIEKRIGVLFIASLVTAMGFSAMQSTFPLFLSDTFKLDEKTVGYFFGFIGLISLIYQGYFIRITRKYLNEKSMILFGLFCLSVGFLGFSLNTYYYLVFAFVSLFPIGYGTINPAIGSLQAKMSPNHTGQILGINTSVVSMGNILGPFIAGYLYTFSPKFPYFFSVIMFLSVLVFVKYVFEHE